MKSSNRFRIFRSIPLILMTAAFPLFFHSCNSDEEIAVISPDRMNSIVFILHEGKACYLVQRAGTTVIDSSLLGFEFGNGESLAGEFRMKEARITGDHKRWETSWGQQKRVLDWHSKLSVILEETNGDGRILQIEFKASNDGVAFRYLIPEQDGLSEMMISRELTEFRFTGDLSAWWSPGDQEMHQLSYRKTPLSEVGLAHTPIILESTDSLCVRIHEAALIDYPEMRLRRSDNGLLTLDCDPVPLPDGTKARVKTPFTSPWRTIQLSKTPGGLIESDMILNLNEPSAFEDETWIRPMKYITAGTRLAGNGSPVGLKPESATARAKRTIDFADANGIPGVMVEGWEEDTENRAEEESDDKAGLTGEYDLEEVAAYARDKGVFLIAQHEAGGDAGYFEKQLDSVFAYYERLGIRAVKVGYEGQIMPSGQHLHGQLMVKHQAEVIRAAARHKLMIDASDDIRSTGLERTWPNYMMGDHAFVSDSRTTLAKQLALMVVNFSPLQMTADLIGYEQGHPAFQFSREIPSDWDDTRVLLYQTGDYLTVARKKNNSWYIGSVTDENARDYVIKLDFLDDGNEYEAVVYTDGPAADYENNPLDFVSEKRTVRKGDELTVKLARGGGQAVVVRLI